GQAVLGFEHVAVAGEHQRMLTVGHDEHGFEPAQHAVCAPVARQLYRSAHEVALVFFELGLEALLQGERVGGGAGKAGQHLVMVQPADFARCALEDDVAEGDLPIAAYGDLVAAPNADDGGSVKLFHGFFPLNSIDRGGRLEFKAQTMTPIRRFRWSCCAVYIPHSISGGRWW